MDTLHVAPGAPRNAAQSQCGAFGILATVLGMSMLLAIGPLHAQPVQDALDNQELIRQQERERALRERLETTPDVRLEAPSQVASGRLPMDESPCFVIDSIALDGEGADDFRWALRAADPTDDPATGRCLGGEGVNEVIRRVQNVIIARGFVTTRVVAAPQDLKSGLLALTIVPGRVRVIRYADDADTRATLGNAIPIRPGELLNLRAIEQALENLQRLPTVIADIQIAPAEDAAAQPGESDLVVSRQQRAPARYALTLDDSGSDATGQLQGGATLSLDGWARANDLFYVNLGQSVFQGDDRKTSSWTAHYSLPFGWWLFGANAGAHDYRQAVAGAYETYVYSGSSRNAELRASRLLFRNASARFGAYGRGWWRESDNYIDDTEIEVQRRRVAGWEIGLTHRHFLGTATLDANAAYRRGTGAFDALPAPEEAFGEGASRPVLIVADMQLAVPFQAGAQRLRYTGSARAQWHRTPLVPQDRFSIGGRYTVRGFDGEVALSGERGWLVRNDLGLALGGGQEAYAGVDFGRVGGPSVEWQLGHRLAGAVIGLRGGWRGMHWDAFAGAPLDRPSYYPTAYTTVGFSMGWSH